MSVCMSAVSAGISEVLIKYTGKYVNICFIMKITYLLYFYLFIFFPEVWVIRGCGAPSQVTEYAKDEEALYQSEI